MEELICREGTVHSVIFQNAENGYTVLRLLTEEGEVVTVVGCIPCVAPGEHLTVTGTWETHPQHGEQLKAAGAGADACRRRKRISSPTCPPASARGVGPTTARRIVDRFGLETLDILEAEPERLQEIRGITAKKAMEIGDALPPAHGPAAADGIPVPVSAAAGAGHPAAAAVRGRGAGGGAAESLSAVRRCVRRGFFRNGHHGAVHGLCGGLRRAAPGGGDL